MFVKKKGLGEYTFIHNLFTSNDDTQLIKVTNGNGRTTVLKMLLKSKRMSKEFMNEVEVMKEISRPGSNPFIIEMVDFFQCQGRNVIVLEYINRGSLRQHLDAVPSTDAPFDRQISSSTTPISKTFPLYTTSFYSACMLLALSYLHCCNVTHSDVSLRNMMVGGDGYVKLIDFGRAKINYDIPLHNRPDFYSDYKQLGLVIYEMLTGEFTFHATMDALKTDRLDTSSLEAIDQMLNLKENLIRHDGRDAMDIFADLQFFKKIDFQKLQSKDLESPVLANLKHDGLLENRGVWDGIVKESSHLD